MNFLQNRRTHFLRFVILLMGIIVLALCIFALPSAWMEGPAEFPIVKMAVYLLVISFYATTIPFYIGLWQTLKLLKLIDTNSAFSELSVKALRTIKYCASVVSAFYLVNVVLVYPLAEIDDAPGLIPMAAVVACMPITITVFAAVLEKLLRNALDIKSENDLTV